MDERCTERGNEVGDGSRGVRVMLNKRWLGYTQAVYPGLLVYFTQVQEEAGYEDRGQSGHTWAQDMHQDADICKGRGRVPTLLRIRVYM